jgi:hypothetical protein
MNFMSILSIFAASGYFFNDVLAILSVVGSVLLFLSLLFSNGISTRLVSLGEWGMAPLVFGSFFQVALIITGVNPDSIGFIVRIPTGVVNGLFVISILLVASWWLEKTRKRDDNVRLSR